MSSIQYLIVYPYKRSRFSPQPNIRIDDEDTRIPFGCDYVYTNAYGIVCRGSDTDRETNFCGSRTYSHIKILKLRQNIHRLWL